METISLKEGNDFLNTYMSLLYTASAIIIESGMCQQDEYILSPDLIFETFLQMDRDAINAKFKSNFRNIMKYYIKQKFPNIDACVIVDSTDLIFPYCPIALWFESSVLFVQYSQDAVNSFVDTFYAMLAFSSNEFVNGDIYTKETIRTLEEKKKSLLAKLLPSVSEAPPSYPNTIFGDYLIGFISNTVSYTDQTEIGHTKIKEIWTTKNELHLVLLSHFARILEKPIENFFELNDIKGKLPIIRLALPKTTLKSQFVEFKPLEDELQTTCTPAKKRKPFFTRS